jgi:hypothetical protein
MTTLTTLEILTQARELLSDPTKWTQHAMARDANGDDKPISHLYSEHPYWEGISGYDPVACSWCAFGAIEKVSNMNSGTVKYILSQTAKKLYSMRMPKVNDSLGHTEVLKVYDHAIEDETK